MAAKKVTARRTGSTAQKKPGSPRHERDPKIASIIELCRAIGYSQEQTCRVAGIANRTLTSYYADEWEKGADRVSAKISGNLATIASSPTHPRAVTAAIFWLKTRLGWVDNHVKFSAGNGGGEAGEGEDGEELPITFTIKIGEKSAAGPG